MRACSVQGQIALLHGHAAGVVEVRGNVELSRTGVVANAFVFASQPLCQVDGDRTRSLVDEASLAVREADAHRTHVLAAGVELGEVPEHCTCLELEIREEVEFAFVEQRAIAAQGQEVVDCRYRSFRDRGLAAS